MLLKLANKQLCELQERMDKFQADLDTVPVDLDTLKFVLITIEQIAEIDHRRYRNTAVR